MQKNFKFLENESVPAPTDCLRQERQGEPQKFCLLFEFYFTIQNQSHQEVWKVTHILYPLYSHKALVLHWLTLRAGLRDKLTVSDDWVTCWYHAHKQTWADHPFTQSSEVFCVQHCPNTLQCLLSPELAQICLWNTHLTSASIQVKLHRLFKVLSGFSSHAHLPEEWFMLMNRWSHP